MRILLTGAQGFVGARIREHMPVIAAPSLRNASLDQVKRLMDEIRPDAIIHTAAISDIPACEKDPEGSYQANVLLPVYLAKAAGSSKLVMFRSDQVYAGCEEAGPYQEDIVCPPNRYAKQKLEMEQRVLDMAPDAVMLRATWMYDMPIYGVKNRGNFIVNMLKAAAEHAPLSFSDTQYRGVTYAREVARCTELSLSLPGGAYNFGSENHLSMYETACFLRDELHLNLPLERGENRHNLWMNCTKLKENGIHFPSTVEGLRMCIQDYQLG